MQIYPSFTEKKQKKILESMGDRVEVTTGLLCELLALLRAVCIKKCVGEPVISQEVEIKCFNCYFLP